MDSRTARRTARTASVGALASAAAAAVELAGGAGPAAAELIALATFAPALAVVASWWLASRHLRLALLAFAVLLELPAVLGPAVASALLVETFLLAALLATPFDARAPRYHGRLSIVL